jgi:hypothetical protein
VYDSSDLASDDNKLDEDAFSRAVESRKVCREGREREREKCGCKAIGGWTASRRPTRTEQACAAETCSVEQIATRAKCASGPSGTERTDERLNGRTDAPFETK